MIAKGFNGHIDTVQRNAIQSWCLLKPDCQIVLCVNDPGTGKIATKYGVEHIPNIAKNEYGTPFLSSAFEEVERIARHTMLCYVNADIILPYRDSEGSAKMFVSGDNRKNL